MSVLSSRYFTMTGVANERPQSLPAPTVTALRARHDDRAFGNHDRQAFGRLENTAVRQVVDRRRARQHRAGADDRAALHDRPFVDAGVAADQHLVLDDDGQGADRFDHAADLRAGADVHLRPDLRARSDQRVAVDQGAFADVRADVDVHRRHADHAPADEGAFPHGRSARHQADLAVERERLDRHRVLVEERPLAVIHRDVDQAPEPEPEQDSLLHPRVHTPAGRRVRVGLGGADRSLAERVAQADKGRAGHQRLGSIAQVEKLFDVGLEFGHWNRPRTPGCGLRLQATGFRPASTSVWRIFCGARLRWRHHRQTIHRFAQSEHRQRRLHGNRVGLDEVHQHQRQQGLMLGARGGEVAGERGIHQPGHAVGHEVGRDRDHAAAADRHQRQRQRVVATEHREVVGDDAADLAHLLHVARGFLDPHDVGDRGQARQRSRLDVAAGAAGHVVDDDRQRRPGGNRAVVLVQAFLRGLVVVRRHREQALDPERLGGVRELGHLGGVVAADAGEHGDLPRADLDGDADHGIPLGPRQRRRLARRATGHDEVDAATDLPLHQRAQRPLIHGARRRKRRHQRRADSRPVSHASNSTR